MEWTPRRTAAIWIGLAAAVGLALIALYPKSAEPDAGFHFLKARWAFDRPEWFVDVWARPLFQAAFAIPAQGGFAAARVFALLLALATAWNTYRVAGKLGFPNAPLAVPLLFLQPVWLVNATDTMTEPLFAFAFVLALRLRLEGRPGAAMLTASLLPLARPEGFVIAALWGAWTLLDRADPRPLSKRLPSISALAAGTVAWWFAALAISGDPLYILHHWPAIWDPGTVVFGRGPIYAYALQLPEIVGPVLLIPFLAGVWTLTARRQHGILLSIFLAIFVLHSVIWFLGRFGSVGYARYLICVAPAAALITLAGWHRISAALVRFPRSVALSTAAAALAGSLLLAAREMDARPLTRDGSAMENLVESFRRYPIPVTRFAWSQPHACILFGANPEENPRWTADRKVNLGLIRALPAGTLVFWDGRIGKSWYRVDASDFLAEGFLARESATLRLEGFFRSEPLDQRLDLLWKPVVNGPNRK